MLGRNYFQTDYVFTCYLHMLLNLLMSLEYGQLNMKLEKSYLCRPSGTNTQTTSAVWKFKYRLQVSF